MTACLPTSCCKDGANCRTSRCTCHQGTSKPGAWVRAARIHLNQTLHTHDPPLCEGGKNA